MLKRLSAGMSALAAVCLVFLMLVTFVDVMGRYFLDAPLTYAVELTELAMGLVIFLGLAVTTLNRGHIAVDLLSSALQKGAGPQRLIGWLRRLAAFSGVVFIGLMSWRLFDRATNFMSDGLTTQVLTLPVYPVVFIMSAAALIAAAIALQQMLGRESDGGANKHDV